MSIEASTTVEVTASAREVLELVLDLDAYRVIDPKIRQVRSLPVIDGDGRGTAQIVGSLWRFPPAPDTHLVHLERWHTVTYEGAPGVAARLLYDFTGRFQTQAVQGGTRLTHSYEIAFRRPIATLFDARVHRWLEADLAEEMGRLHAHLGPLTSR